MSDDPVLHSFRARGPGGITIRFAKQGVPLHSMLESVGYDRCVDPAYDWRGKRRLPGSFCLIQHTLSGSGWIECRKVRQRVRAGDTMLLHFPDDNRYWLGRNPEWEFFWLSVSGREPARIWRALTDLTGPVVRLNETAIRELADLCMEALEGRVATAPEASKIAYSATMTLMTYLWPQHASAASTSPLVTQAKALTRARIMDPGFDVAAMAAHFGYSRSHFTRWFTAVVGQTPARFVLTTRLEQSARLLADGRYSVKQVASLCGFPHASYFAKAFVRRYGVLPRETKLGEAIRS